VNQSGPAVPRIANLVQRVQHQLGDQLVAAAHRRAAMGTVGAMLNDKPLVGQPAQHCHDGGCRPDRD